MLGRTREHRRIRPRGGVIADFEITRCDAALLHPRAHKPVHAGEAAHHHRDPVGHPEWSARHARGRESAGRAEVYLTEQPMPRRSARGCRSTEPSGT